MRGYGYSSNCVEIERVEDLAHDIKVLIVDVLKLKKFYLLGHSFGCLIATMIAVKVPSMIAGLI